MSRRTFGATWWGRAWIDALEQRARLDPNRLPRGRTYARAGRVGTLQVTPGVIRARVQGSRAVPYEVLVRVRPFTDAEWDRLLDTIAARAGHTAALLDGELTPEIATDARDAGVDLLPVAGEVGPHCTCPDWADPCKHAAAVVYLLADVVDADPFALLHLRGMARESVLAALRQRRARPGRAVAVVSDEGVDPGSRGAPGPLPAVPPPPRTPGRPAALATEPPARSGLRGDDLMQLAADAAERAWAMCLGEGDGDLGLEPRLDLARRLAASLGTNRAWWPAERTRFDAVAQRTGMRPRELARLASAWRHGGADGVGVLDEVWTPDDDGLDEGRAVCPPGSRVRGNRITLPGSDVQLRLSRGGSWYRFERVGRAWELTGGPAADPAELVTVAAAPSR